MEVGIVGLPNVGKSSLFNALTAAKADSANYPFCTIEPNVGVVPVPDRRLELINSFMPTEKIIPASVRVLDIAGLVRGASKGEGLGNKFLSHIREVDAILHVVRCFADENVTHVEGSLDPIRDIETIDMELMLADLESVESSLAKLVRQVKTGDKEAKIKVDVFEAVAAALREGRPARSLGIDDPEKKKILRNQGLMTAKKVLYVANVSEEDPHGQSDLPSRVRAHAAKEGSGMVAISSKLEAELAELPPADRQEMLESLGMTEPALASLAGEAYRLLGLQSYFTAGPKEIRAWTIQVGATAPEAAGVIHTDFQKGFIRAEVYQVKDLQEFKTESAIRSAGKMRTEGKSYVFQDGDVAHFLFNV